MNKHLNKIEFTLLYDVYARFVVKKSPGYMSGISMGGLGFKTLMMPVLMPLFMAKTQDELMAEIHGFILMVILSKA